jgi:alpha-methylacyl-CoA racemase
MAGLGLWKAERHSNLLDGAAPHYDVYETRDGKFVSVGPLEPQFFALFAERTGLDAGECGLRNDADEWPRLKSRLSAIFRTRSQKEWCDLLEGSDACFAPVLDFAEAPMHAHNRARETYIDINGAVQAAPAPRFSRSACDTPGTAHAEGADTEAVLRRAGFDAARIASLRKCGALP